MGRASNNLGSLAALAGMAYLANRDKGGEGSAPATPTAADEGAIASPVRSGEVEETKLDKMADVPRSRPRSVTPAKAAASADYGNEGRRSVREPSPPAYETPYDRSRREDRESGRDIGSMVESLKNRIATAGERGSALPLKSTKSDKNDFMGAGMKKGGAVKGWGISRGARKAKNY
jgi:hypothetical protein